MVVGVDFEEFCSWGFDEVIEVMFSGKCVMVLMIFCLGELLEVDVFEFVD